MSNVIDLLLNADLEQIERPSKEVEIKDCLIYLEINLQYYVRL